MAKSSDRVTRKEKREKETAIFAEPETLDDLCDFISGGDGNSAGTLAGWCQKMGVRYTPAYTWLHDPEVPERLKAYVKALEARNARLIDSVIEGAAGSAKLDIRKLFDAQGAMLSPEKLPDEVAQSVTAIEEDETQMVGKDGESGVVKVKRKVKIESRQGAREQLGRHLGMFKDGVELGGQIKVEDATPEESARRLGFALAAALQEHRKGGVASLTNKRKVD